MLAGVVVFLVRHAHADAGDPDELRRLSARGHAEARALGEQLAGESAPPALVLTSPLLRARETAEAIAAAVGAPVRVDERLGPGMTLPDLQDAVAGQERPVAAVGHQPDCSNVALELTGADPGFATGSFRELTLEQ
jgi:phosphohistidine phosphatase